MAGDDHVLAPWTAEQVTSLNAYQHSGVFHEFTCGGRQHRDGGPMLIATPSGWICPDGACTYRQDWAWRWMADGTWRLTGQMRKEA